MKSLKTQISETKFIVASGCSYGEIVTAISQRDINFNIDFFNQKLSKEFEELGIEKFEKFDDNILFLSVAVASQGSEWQSDSIMYTVTRLLELGAKPENIYAIVEWSQWSRYTFTTPSFLEDDLKNKYLDENLYGLNNTRIATFLCSRYNSKKDELTQFIGDSLNINQTNGHFGNIGKLNDSYYITPDHIGINEIRKDMGDSWYFLIDKLKEYNDYIFLEMKVKKYLDNIIRTQNFFKLNGIKYNFFQMQGCFSGWYSEAKMVKHKLTHEEHRGQCYMNGSELVYDENYDPLTNIENFIEERLPQYKFLFNQIDFTKFWHYNSEKYKRGGVDEFSMDNFGETVFTNFSDGMYDLEKNEFNGDLNNPFFGNHPNSVVYQLIWHEVAKDCEFLKYTDEFIKKLKEKGLEDISSENITENGFFLSKKYFWKLANIRKFLT